MRGYTTGKRLGVVCSWVILPLGWVILETLDAWRWFRGGFRQGLWGDHVDDAN